MPNLENIWQWLLTALFSILGVMYNDQKKKIENLEERLKEHESTFAAHRENTAAKYVTREELKSEFAEVKELLHRLNDKLDRKVDK